MKENKLIKYLSLAISCVIILCFHSCNSSLNKQLQQAEQLVKNSPDSAFHILTAIRKNYSGMNNTEKALFGYLYFRASDNKTYHKDSTEIEHIDFSIDYYNKHSDKPRLAECYLYKSHVFKDKFLCTEAINYLLKAKDIAETLSDNELLGKIYFDLGHISAFFEKYDKALTYFNQSIKSYEQCGNNESAGRVHMTISWLYSATQNYNNALSHTLKALSLVKDSLTIGDLLEDIGDLHLANKTYDSAYVYFQQSLLYPALKTNKSIRYYGLAKLFLETGQYDSSKAYIDKAMSVPIDITYKANCYRLLAGIASEIGTKQELEQYVSQYQIYQDSVNKRKRQPNIDVVEKIYQSDVENAGIKNQRSLLIAGVLILLLAGSFIFYYFHKRNKKKQKAVEYYQEKLSENLNLYNEVLQQVETYRDELKNKEQTVDYYKNKHFQNLEFYEDVQHQIDIYKNELKKKHDLLLNTLKQELEITKEKYYSQRKKAPSPQERDAIDKAVYNTVLQLDNETAFIQKMNQVLNNLPQKLQTDYPDITYQQTVWCCLFVLDLFTTDIALIMDYAPNSLYKFKQRLSKKLNFSNVKELEQMLHEKVDL